MIPWYCKQARPLFLATVRHWVGWCCGVWSFFGVSLSANGSELLRLYLSCRPLRMLLLPWPRPRAGPGVDISGARCCWPSISRLRSLHEELHRSINGACLPTMSGAVSWGRRRKQMKLSPQSGPLTCILFYFLTLYTGEPTFCTRPHTCCWTELDQWNTEFTPDHMSPSSFYSLS